MPFEFLSPIDILISTILFFTFILPYTKRSYLQFQIDKIRGVNDWQNFVMWFTIGRFFESLKRTSQPWKFTKNIKEMKENTQLNIHKTIKPLATDSEEVLRLINDHKKYTTLTVITFAICGLYLFISIFFK
ncbi:hypothetical protein DR864_22115 [Runella rosea]|uniref:Uncharacterized protein n=1 Tax=Runella rosea TaxID=2259595 RepID=A0A344TNN3_9BACT|nr:hypothetical protein [Runella rosea]AXE20254.1 hypothetical protein DR864_22115 [Runella rosea]